MKEQTDIVDRTARRQEVPPGSNLTSPKYQSPAVATSSAFVQHQAAGIVGSAEKEPQQAENYDPAQQPSGAQFSISSDDSFRLDLVSSRICQVIVPVTLCSIYVVLLLRILEWNVLEADVVVHKTWYQLGIEPDTREPFSTTELIKTIKLVGVIVMAVVAVTLVVLFVFYMEWHSCLNYYFYMPSFLIMVFLTPFLIRRVLTSLDWFSMDLITLVVLVWNFTSLGMISIFNLYTSAPLYVQQFYLIHNSATIALVAIIFLPGWAPWILLVFFVFWDLFAVLSPIGPLNLIIGMAEKEGVVDMPGLLYNTDSVQAQSEALSRSRASRRQTAAPVGRTASPAAGSRGSNELNTRTIESDPSIAQVVYQQTTVAGAEKMLAGTKVASGTEMAPEVQTRKEASVADIGGGSGVEGAAAGPNEPVAAADSAVAAVSARQKTASERRISMQEKGVNIGLGDFIFYSLLIGLTAKGRETVDFYTTLATLSATLVGLVLTLIMLALNRRALPALPISIGLGLVVAGLTMHLVPNLANALASNQIFY